VAESIVTLRVEARNAISSLNKTSQATKTLSKSANGATASLTAASSAAKGLGASLAASLGPLLTVGAAFATVGSAIGTFTARERDIAILTQGLKNLGAGTAQLNELQEAANKLGNQTLFNQEEFTRGFNLLTSFRKIGVDSYERVAQAAADIAQVNQVDVSTSFMQLAKALQDPERNLSNLNRSGIAFTKQQTEVIKELMKTNKTAEAHAMILSIVEESYNKLAQAAAEGFAGNVDSLGEAFRDFSETLGKTLEPALITVTKSLTEFIKVTNDFIRSPIAGTAAIFTGIALAAKGTIAVIAAVKTGLIAVGGAAGVAAVALNAIPFVAAATLVGAFTTKIMQAAKEQRDFNKALQDGEIQIIKSEFNKLFIERQKLLKRKREAEESSNKKVLQSLKRQLQINEEALEPIRAKLKEEIATSKEIENQNKNKKDQKDINDKLLEDAKKLKEAMTAVGEEIEGSIKNNLREAITGAQSFGQAMTNVLNRIRDKIIDAQIEKLIGGFGENFGKGASGEEKKGLGGFLGGILGGLFKANGGPVKAGKPYIVGERQPELFVPRTSGTILPSTDIGGGSTTNNMITVNVDASGTSVQGNGSEADQLGQLIGGIVQATLVEESRAGGLLNR
jgi:hypothetical protein